MPSPSQAPAPWLNRLQSLGLRAQRWLLVLVFCLEAALVAGYLALAHARLDADIERTLRNTSLLHARAIELRLDAMRHQLQSIGNLVLLGRAFQGASARALLRSELKHNELDAAILVDSQGRFVAVESMFPIEKALSAKILQEGGFHRQPLYQQYRQREIDEDLYFWTGSGLDPEFSGFVLFKAIRDGQGSFRGAVYGFLDSRSLENFLRSAQARGFDLGPDGVVTIVDRATGRGLSRYSREGGSVASLPHADPALLKLATPDARTILSYRSPVDQVQRLGAIMQINQGRWVQVVAVSQRDYLQGWRLQLGIGIVLFLLLAQLQWRILHIAHSSHLQRLQLAHESRHDPLTGLANRRHFNEWAGTAVSLARRHRQPLALLSLDLDFFKKINDSHGHDAGDAVLRETARTLQAALREGDFAARFGGEEFIVALPQTELEAARSVAERIRANLAALAILHHDQVLNVTVSIGVTGVTQAELEAKTGAQGLEPALERADEALYLSKQNGRNRVSVLLAA